MREMGDHDGVKSALLVMLYPHELARLGVQSASDVVLLVLTRLEWLRLSGQLDC